jgi:hypothetical protein
VHQVLIFEGIVKKPLKDVTAATADLRPWCWSHLPRRLSGIRPSPYTALIPPIWSLAHSGSGAPSLVNSTLSLLRKLVCEMRGFVALFMSYGELYSMEDSSLIVTVRVRSLRIARDVELGYPVCPSVRRVQGSIINNPVPQRTSIESHGKCIHVSCRRQLRNRSQTSAVA